MSKLVNERGHALIEGAFEFGLIVLVRFFAKSIDAALKRSTTSPIA
jgi:hypothetical protein